MIADATPMAADEGNGSVGDSTAFALTTKTLIAFDLSAAIGVASAIIVVSQDFGSRHSLKIAIP